MKDTVFVKEHPKLPRSSWKTAIPLGVHGDGGAFSHHDSLYTISWNSLFSSGNTVAKRFVFTVLRKSEMTPDTLDTVFDIFAWSMNALLDGITPDFDHLKRPIKGGGETIAGGFTGVLAQCRGDWQFYCELFKFPQWNAAERMCWFCDASSTIRHLSWMNMGPTAGWRDHFWTHAEYLAHLADSGIRCPLLQDAIGFRLEQVMVDVLHAVDQAVASHIIANVFWFLVIVKNIYRLGTQSEKVQELNKRLKVWQSKRKSPLQGKLTVERLRTKGKWPKLKARAAQTRHLADYAYELMLEHCNLELPHERRILAVIQLLVRFYNILASPDMFFSEEARVEVPSIGRKMMMLYQQLAEAAIAEGQKKWKLSPKHHIFLHLCEIQCPLLGNPRFYWCYADEDLVGKMIEIAHSVHPLALAVAVLTKWLHLYFPDDR